MAKKTVFISYDYDNDRHFKNMLLAWDKNKAFDFEFYDGSLRAAINSTDAAYIKSKLKVLIAKSTHVLCIIGQEGGTNEWINWEVETGAIAGKKLVAVKLDRSYESPPAIRARGASWAMSFTFDAIKKALDEA